MLLEPSFGKNVTDFLADPIKRGWFQKTEGIDLDTEHGSSKAEEEEKRVANDLERIGTFTMDNTASSVK